MAIILYNTDIPSWPVLTAGLAVLLVVHRIVLIIYRLYFHPLAKFPGPRLYAASYFFPLVRDKLQGRLTKDMLDIHEKYGPIVRISPDRLSIDGSIGWQDIFGLRGDRPEFAKTAKFYQIGQSGIFPADRDNHRRQRRLLSHAFSNAALQEQEMYVKTYLNLLISQLRSNMEQGKAVDMTRWYNYTTFDIIGELAFADPFHSLENSEYHPWVALIFSSIKAKDIKKFVDSKALAREKTNKRLALGDDATRKDFMTYILRHNQDGKGMTHEEIHMNSLALIIAGSETTATALSGLTFYLTQNPEVYKALATEIRTAFSSDEEITMQSTMKLQYLGACLEEILRLYPPAPETPPRISPGEVVGGHYIPKGTHVTIYQWATNHSPRNFLDPEKFAPERWLPLQHPLYEPKYSSDNKAASKPFSFGSRDCIGKNLAYAEMRMVISRILFNFDLERLPGQDDWISRQRIFIVHEKGPLMIRLAPVSKT